MASEVGQGAVRSVTSCSLSARSYVSARWTRARDEWGDMRGHRAALAEWWEVMERWRTSPDYRADLDYGVISSQSLLDDIAARELRDARRDIQRRCQPTPDFAQLHASVLLLGDSGVGKSTLANAVGSVGALEGVARAVTEEPTESRIAWLEWPAPAARAAPSRGRRDPRREPRRPAHPRHRNGRVDPWCRQRSRRSGAAPRRIRKRVYFPILPDFVTITRITVPTGSRRRRRLMLTARS